MGQALVFIRQSPASFQMTHMHSIASPAFCFCGNQIYKTANIGFTFTVPKRLFIAIIICPSPSDKIIIPLRQSISIKIFNHIIIRDNLVLIDIAEIIVGIIETRVIGGNRGQAYITCALGIINGRQSGKHVGVHPLAAGGIGPGCRGRVIRIKVHRKILGRSLTIRGTVITQVPVGRRKFVCIHPGLPGHVLRITVVHRVTNGPGPVITNGTPFGHKNRQPMRYGVISVRCIIAAGGPVVRKSRIEMEGIGDIGVINRTTNDITGPRRPLRRTHHNQVVGIAANNGNHFLRIRLDFGPSNHATILIAHVTGNIGPCAMTRFAKGFIEYLENHVVISAPLLCLNLEKFLSTIDIFRSDVRMVVDNHVDVILDSRLDCFIKQVLIILGLAVHKVMPVTPFL